MLEFDWRVALYAIINFAVLAGLLTLFLYKPVLRMLDQRQADIDQALAEAAQAKRLAATTESRLQEEAEQAREQAAALVAAGREQAEQERQRLLAQAQQEAEQVARIERERLAQERVQAERELEKRAARLAVEAAEQLLRQGLTEKQQLSLIDNYIQEAGGQS